MRGRHVRRTAIAIAGTCLIAGTLGGSGVRPARAGEPGPTLAIGAARDGQGLHPMPPAGRAGHRAGVSPTSASGWWLGMSAVALALAAFGALSLASRRFLSGPGAGPLEVLGRTSLSPKHTVYLLRAGDRVLIVGTGAQGAPSLLGEWTGALDQWPSMRRGESARPAGGGTELPSSHGDQP